MTTGPRESRGSANLILIDYWRSCPKNGGDFMSASDEREYETNPPPCDHCGGRVRVQQVILSGNAMGDLCPACHNEWAATLNDSEAKQEEMEIAAVESHYNTLAFAGQAVSLDD